MTLEELLKLVPDENKDAVSEFVNGLSGKITTLSNEIKSLEAKSSSKDMQDKLDKAIKKRDAAKAQLTIVRDTIGLPSDKEISKELINEHIEDSKKGDKEKDNKIEALKADIDALQDAVETLKKEKANIEKERDQVTEETKFIKVFSENMPSFKAASPVARGDIEKLLRSGAVLEDGQIFYKTDEGYVRVEGERMTMKTKLAELQENPDYDYLFETKASGGSGSGNKGSRSGSLSKFEKRKQAAGIS